MNGDISQETILWGHTTGVSNTPIIHTKYTILKISTFWEMNKEEEKKEKQLLRLEWQVARAEKF